PFSSSLAFTSGSLSALTISPLRRAAIPPGRPAGPDTPNHDDGLRKAGITPAIDGISRPRAKRAGAGTARNLMALLSPTAGGLEHGQNLDGLAVADRERVRDRDEGHGNMPGNDILQRRRHAAVGHVVDLHAGGLVEQLAHQMENGADTGGAIAELARPRLRIGDKLRNRTDRQRAIDDQARAPLHPPGDPPEILHPPVPPHLPHR